MKLEIEGEYTELLDDPARALAQADILPRSHRSAADPPSPDLAQRLARKLVRNRHIDGRARKPKQPGQHASERCGRAIHGAAPVRSRWAGVVQDLTGQGLLGIAGPQRATVERRSEGCAIGAPS